MSCALVGKTHSGRAYDGAEVPPGFFELFVYNNIIKLCDVAYFFARGAQAPLDRLFAVLAPPSQTALELREDRGRRKDEDAHRIGKGLAYLLGALPIDFEQDVPVLGARFGDRLLGGA